jgi:ATP-dependent RNA helicase RhlE
VLVLTPTRELAAQVEENVRAYGKHLPLQSMVIFGGVGMNPQIDRRDAASTSWSPRRAACSTSRASNATSTSPSVEILVLDEADRMLDMGFIHDIRRVLALLPRASRPALQRHLLATRSRAGRPPAQEPGAHRGGAPQHHRRHRRAARLL